MRSDFDSQGNWLVTFPARDVEMLKGTAEEFREASGMEDLSDVEAIAMLCRHWWITNDD